MDVYINDYLEKHPKELQMVMAGVFAFGNIEMETIIEEALLHNKRFYIKHDSEKFDLATYKLIDFKK